MGPPLMPPRRTTDSQGTGIAGAPAAGLRRGEPVDTTDQSDGPSAGYLLPPEAAPRAQAGGGWPRPRADHPSLPLWIGGSPVSVEERVIEIVSEQMGVAKDQVTRETSFVNDLGADSLDTVELVMEFEEEFDITISDEEAEKIQTVGQAIQYIEEHTK